MRRNIVVAALLSGGLIVPACDRSPQAADGATAPGDPGSAAATGNGTIAATGGTERGAENATPTDKGVEKGLSTSPSGAPNTLPPEVAREAR